MEILSKKNFLPDVAGMNLKPRVDCLVGKQHRVSFHIRSPSRRGNTLDLVHTNVCSMDVRSLGGAQYYVTFINDHLVVHNIMLPLSMIILERYGLLY